MIHVQGTIGLLRKNVLRGRFYVLAALVLLGGCGGTIRTDYGRSKGIAGDQSINGFGILRRSYERYGWSTRDVNRLNERVESLDAIVWIPQYPDTIYSDAEEWFENWLALGGKTLIYVFPDRGCEARYFEQARKVAPGSQKLAYRRRLAKLETDEMLERVRSENQSESSWFVMKPLPLSSVTTQGQGPWGKSSAAITSAEADLAGLPANYEVTPVPLASNAANSPAAGSPASSASTTGVTVAPEDQLEHEVLLTNQSQAPVIASLRADRWSDSRILVIGGGSLLCNFTAVSPAGQALIQRVIEDTEQTSASIGFMTTDYQGAVVSSVDMEINRVTGLELFTVWPLNLVVLHLAVLGFVVCMILLPIFGRPREAKDTATHDFVSHLDAVASLMSKSGGEDYARRRVSEYMKRVRGETKGPWVIVDPVVPAANATDAKPLEAVATGPTATELTRASESVSTELVAVREPRVGAAEDNDDNLTPTQKEPS